MRRQTLEGARWTATASIINVAVGIVQLTVLARLLQPDDFGLMAIVLIATGFAQTFADAGVSSAIIHRQDATRAQLSTLYWMTLVNGVVMFAALQAVTPALQWFFDEPRLAGPLRLTSVVFLVIPLGQQFEVLLQRELRFRRLALFETGSAAAGMVVAVVCAALGLGVFSLVWGQLTAATVRSALLFATGVRTWRPEPVFRLRDVREHLQFGLYQMGDRAVNFFNQRVDQLLIGSLAGASALGYYTVAYNLVMQPITRINPILTRVAFPVFARVQHDVDRVRRGFMLVRSVLATFNAPLVFGFAAVAPLVVPGVLGSRWGPSVPLIQILATVAVLRSVGNPIGSVLLALGRADRAFHWNLCLFVSQTIGVYLGAAVAGAIGVATAVLTLQILYFGAGYAYLARPLLGPCLREYLGSVVPPISIAAVMAVVVASIPLALRTGWISVAAVQVGTGLCVYLGLTALLSRRRLQELVGLVRR